MNSLIIYGILSAALIAVVPLLALIIKKQRRHKAISEAIQTIGPEVGPALKEVSGLFNYNHYIIGCSNQRLGCDYREMKFVNLNQKMRRR